MVMQPQQIKGRKTLLSERPKAILLIQLGDIGDVVYSFPCARALKETFPDAQIVFAVRAKAAGLISGCSWADDVIVIDTERRGFWGEVAYQSQFWRQVRSYRFDMAIDLRRDSRGAYLAFLSGASIRVAPYSVEGKLLRNRLFTHLYEQQPKVGLHIIEHYMEPMAAYGINTENLIPKITVYPKMIAEANGILAAYGLEGRDNIVAIQPFSLWSYKEWKKEKMAVLIRRVREEHGLSVIIVGGPDERERAEEIALCAGAGVYNLAGKTSIAVLPALLQKCCLFLGVDSAGLHIAAAVGTPTIGLYGPSAFVTWAPIGEKHFVVCKDFPCVPCNRKGCGDSLVSRCMEELGVDEVYSVMRDQLII